MAELAPAQQQELDFEAEDGAVDAHRELLLYAIPLYQVCAAVCAVIFVSASTLTNAQLPVPSSGHSKST
jgi:hypothetical protein